MMDKDGYVFVYSMDSRISLHVRSALLEARDWLASR